MLLLLLFFVCPRHFIEHVLLLIFDQELRAALHIYKQAIHLADVLNINLCSFASLAHDACCCYELYGVSEARLVADLCQQLTAIITHINILLLTPDIQYLSYLLFRVWFC
eukprot:GHUV01039996.1.p1 GENE.GHUV01039996.1~~GHUV01039996.1.p1  ORF type:complete len:110 (-),score=9.38 GHUV01039996.1:751-1080(-)